MSEKRRFSFMVAIVVLMAPSFVYAEPSVSVLNRLEQALSLLETSNVPVSYVTVTRATVADTSGKTLRVTESSERVVLTPGEKPVRESLYRTSSGDEVDASTGASRRDEGTGVSAWKVIFPSGTDRSLFVFGKSSVDGDVHTAEFGPARGAGSRDGITRGTLSWNTRTGLPVRLEAEPVRDLPFTSHLSFSFEFSDLDGFPFPVRIRFSGEAGFLFFKRKISAVSSIGSFTLEGK